MFNKFNIAGSVLAGMAKTVDIKPARCTRIAHRSAKCNICESNCAVKAIKVGDVGTNIELKQEVCTGCGICINLCPTAVYSLKGASYISFLEGFVKKISENGVLRISCRQNACKDGDAVKTGCLGVIGLTELLYFYTNGAKEVQMDFAECKQCENRYGREVIEDELDELRKLKEVFEHLEDVEIVSGKSAIRVIFPKHFEKPEIKEDEDTLRQDKVEVESFSRREAFTAWRKKAADTAIQGASLLSQDEPQRRTPLSVVKEVPLKRKIFTTSLTRLGKFIKTEVPAGPYFYSQTISEDCKFCQICTRFCHSGALQTSEDGQNIVFNASMCTSCGMCRISCYHGYISTDKAVSLKEFFDSVVKAVKRY